MAFTSKGGMAERTQSEGTHGTGWVEIAKDTLGHSKVWISQTNRVLVADRPGCSEDFWGSVGR